MDRVSTTCWQNSTALFKTLRHEARFAKEEGSLSRRRGSSTLRRQEGNLNGFHLDSDWKEALTESESSMSISDPTTRVSSKEALTPSASLGHLNGPRPAATWLRQATPALECLRMRSQGSSRNLVRAAVDCLDCEGCQWLTQAPRLASA